MRDVPARRWRLAAVALAMGMAAAGCAEGSIGPALGPPVVSTIAPVQSGSVRVSARDNDFITSEIAVAVGTEVVWKNDGRAEHNIVPVDPAAGFKAEQAAFGPKAEYKFTFTKPGMYRYFCSIHGTAEKGMIGAVQVVSSDDVGSKP
jgi:plastocyanin